jgi:cytoskeletal protein CcmA (bactofilin family)
MPCVYSLVRLAQLQRAAGAAARAAALALAVGAAVGALPAAAQSDSASRAEQRIGGDVFVGGTSVAVNEPVPADLFALGGSVDVDAPVGGDAVLAGGKLRVSVDVGRSVYAAGGQVDVLGKVGASARLAGGQVELGPMAEVAGNLSAAAGSVELRGQVKGQVQLAGGRMRIDGPVGGDVVATGGQLTLGPKARIAGKLRYRSSEPLQQDPAAQVSGGIEKLLPALGRGEGAASAPAPRPEPRPGWASPIGVWTVGLMLLAALLVAMLPGFSARVALSLRQRTGWSLLLGFVVLVCAPVAALLLMLTLIGIPLALAGMALYFALLPVAYVAAAIGIGDWALARWQSARAAQRGWRIGAACAALLVLTLLGALPWLGGLVAFAVLLAGLGALWLQATPLRASSTALTLANPGTTS